MAKRESEIPELPYGEVRNEKKETVKDILSQFARNTTVHGVPHIGSSKTYTGKFVWTVVVSVCFFLFCFLTVEMVQKYFRNEKIVDIELKFEQVNFPAITVCNLNPYKNSLLRDVPQLKKTMEVFESSMGTSSEETDENRVLTRMKRSQKSNFEPVLAVCTETGEEHKHVVYNFSAGPETVKDNSTLKMCICTLNRHRKVVTVCRPEGHWRIPETGCDCRSQCICLHFVEYDEEEGVEVPDACMRLPSEGIPLKLWELYPPPPPPPSKEEKEFVEALGYQNMTDEVAIVTRGKENLIFSMAEIHPNERKNLSYTREEFITKCSFNGKQCTMHTYAIYVPADFKLHMDATYGNCYTFNFNKSRNLTSGRAGPTYGLRLLVYVNVSDYLPTTEASGARIAIHQKTQFPFPDTFGYSAPTGFVSSFGIRLTHISRLPAPYGTCVQDAIADTKDYIYTEHEYSPEGCFRSCFQNELIRQCGCGDPRFPVLSGDYHCKAGNVSARECVERMTEEGFHQVGMDCSCAQPCKQAIYAVSFSLSKWPAGISQLRDCNETNKRKCMERYKDNAAMVEIFYEQLNFERLKESEAYGMSNLLADFGGQLGLWMGFSVITCMEFVVLLLDLIRAFLRWRREKKERKLMQKSSEGGSSSVDTMYYSEQYDKFADVHDVNFIDTDQYQKELRS